MKEQLKMQAAASTSFCMDRRFLSFLCIFLNFDTLCERPLLIYNVTEAEEGDVVCVTTAWGCYVWRYFRHQFILINPDRGTWTCLIKQLQDFTSSLEYSLPNI